MACAAHRKHVIGADVPAQIRAQGVITYVRQLYAGEKAGSVSFQDRFFRRPYAVEVEYRIAAFAKDLPFGFREIMLRDIEIHGAAVFDIHADRHIAGGVSDIVRFAPSACNSQPWLVKNDGELSVYRYRKPGKRGIMPADMVSYFNRIDIGIFICFMDICLEHGGIGFEKTLYSDAGDDKELVLNATYRLCR